MLPVVPEFFCGPNQLRIVNMSTNQPEGTLPHCDPSCAIRRHPSSLVDHSNECGVETTYKRCLTLVMNGVGGVGVGVGVGVGKGVVFFR
jgi:hypothetical protein